MKKMILALLVAGIFGFVGCKDESKVEVEVPKAPEVPKVEVPKVEVK